MLMLYNTAARNMVHQGNVPMHVHDVVFNDDYSKMFAVGHNKVVVMQM